MENKINAIIILGGDLKKDKRGWRTTNFGERDNFGITGDRLRVVAASFLYKRTGALIIALGGKGQLKNIPGAPAVAKILKKELIKLGVPPKSIVEENKSGSTFEQLLALNNIVIKKKLRKIALISNRYHLPRIKTIIKCYSDKITILALMLAERRLQLVSAEKVCLSYDKQKWAIVIKNAYKSKAMKRRLLLEKQGVADIKKGKYKVC